MRTNLCVAIILFTAIPIFTPETALSKVLGDTNGDSLIDVSDAVAGLQILSGTLPANANREADIDGDGHIGLAEVIFALDYVSGTRPCMAFVSSNATGSYVYTESNGELTYTITESNFQPGNGPPTGTETVQATITDNTMRLSDGAVWKRITGDPGQITGQWRGEEDRSEYRFILAVDGSMTIFYDCIGGVGYAGMGFHNSPSTVAIYVNIGRAESDVAGVFAEISGPGAVHPDIALTFFEDRQQWGASSYVMPSYPAGGIWWISGIDIEYIDGSRASYVAQDPYTAYAYEVYCEGSFRADGTVRSSHVAQDYVPEAGSRHYYIETFPNASSVDGTDPVMKIFTSGDLEQWFAWNDDGGRSNLAAGIKVPMISGNTYYICVEDPYKNGGSYSIKISPAGFDGMSSGIVGEPDQYEPDDDSENATPIQLNAVQDHSFALGEQDWYQFTAP